MTAKTIFLILRNNANLCLLARKRRGRFKFFLRQKKRIRYLDN